MPHNRSIKSNLRIKGLFSALINKLIMTIVLNGNSLTIEKLVDIARNRENVKVSDNSWKKIDACRKMLQNKIDAHEVMYGITTGIGEFSEVTLTPEQTQEFQKLLVRNHAAGIGEPMDIELVRGAMCGRINVHAKGHSGGRKIITEYLEKVLNNKITPVVCE